MRFPELSVGLYGVLTMRLPKSPVGLYGALQRDFSRPLLHEICPNSTQKTHFVLSAP